MFHGLTSSRVGLGGTSLSRFRPRAFPLLFCKTGFAASMPRRRYRATGAGLLLSAHSIARRPVRRGEVITRGGVKQVWSSRGEGWDVTPGLCAKRISTDEGVLSQSPPKPSETPYL